ncbi:hypothetical protein [Streptomyces nigrescens]|uniref:Uncharacterized protein n=1 Tax=Streptomyces nigrescens TaxID=1920 RepID=A0ABY7IWZ8_STRNI|nr:hypothetical protein [Streptomyces nigrescens]WAU02061.1 hypothetical protein STRNI_000011 [Streptomyces nigrescens]
MISQASARRERRHKTASRQPAVERQEAPGAAPIRHVANNGHGPIAWVTAYEEAYGPPPEIWFTDADGTVDQSAIARFLEIGTLVAEWDCGPAGDDDVASEPETVRR